MGLDECRARVSALLVGYAGWGLGIASAIEPAGGGSPLRGGAGVCELRSYQPKVVANYRGIFYKYSKTIGRGDRFTVLGVTVSPWII